MTINRVVMINIANLMEDMEIRKAIAIDTPTHKHIFRLLLSRGFIRTIELGIS